MTATSVTTYDPSQVWDEAHDAGMTAIMVQSEAGFNENVCGFAWVGSIPVASRMGKWLLSTGNGRKPFVGTGVQVWVSEGDQSIDLKDAYAVAFAAVLKNYGIPCHFGSHLD